MLWWWDQIRRLISKVVLNLAMYNVELCMKNCSCIYNTNKTQSGIGDLLNSLSRHVLDFCLDKARVSLHVYSERGLEERVTIGAGNSIA